MTVSTGPNLAPRHRVLIDTACIPGVRQWILIERKHGTYAARDAHLDEADVLCVFPEALSADVEAVLPDQPPLVAAHAAAGIARQ